MVLWLWGWVSSSDFYKPASGQSYDYEMNTRCPAFSWTNKREFVAGILGFRSQPLQTYARNYLHLQDEIQKRNVAVLRLQEMWQLNPKQ